MSPEEFFKKGVSQISAGRRIRRGEKSIIKGKKRSSPRPKMNDESQLTQKDRTGVKDGDAGRKTQVHIDVTI
jgi:hypothetical protein